MDVPPLVHELEIPVFSMKHYFYYTKKTEIRQGESCKKSQRKKKPTEKDFFSVGFEKRKKKMV